MRSLTATAVVLLSAAALSAQAQAPTPAAPSSTAEPTAPVTPAAEVRPSFADWLDGVRQEAAGRGISAATIATTLSDIPEPLPVVLERDRAQAETVLALETYINRRLTTTLIRRGRDMAARHKGLLDRIGDEYGVPPRIIAGIWGVESNFGAFSGTRPTVAALATLAYDPRRSALFRRELFNALEIVDRGDIEPARLRGSWAGAMGQPQFMPSSYLQFAVDYDKDGRRDIWATPDDVFASIGNYLKGHGWQAGQPWVREVRVSREVSQRVAADVARRSGSCGARRDMTVPLTLTEWQKIGVRTMAGRALPGTSQRASLVSGSSRAFLVFDNYDALLEYNCSNAYALSVVLLGERLAGGAPTPAQPAPARRQAPRRRS